MSGLDGLITMSDADLDVHYMSWRYRQDLEKASRYRQEKLNAECELIVLQGLAKYDPAHEREMARMKRWYPHLADKVDQGEKP